jgi:hypothetical protein
LVVSINGAGAAAVIDYKYCVETTTYVLLRRILKATRRVIEENGD